MRSWRVHNFMKITLKFAVFKQQRHRNGLHKACKEVFLIIYHLISSFISSVVKAMESAMKSMNLEKVQNLMDRFEKDFEDLDVQSATMEGSMNATTTLNAPRHEVDALIQEAADKAGFVGRKINSKIT